MDRLAKEYNIKQDSIAANQNEVRLNPIEELTKESEAWVQGYTSSLGNHLKSAILANRGAIMERKGVKLKQFSYPKRTSRPKY